MAAVLGLLADLPAPLEKSRTVPPQVCGEPSIARSCGSLSKCVCLESRGGQSSVGSLCSFPDIPPFPCGNWFK